ncbi:MAG: aldose epimerase family protein, partial [Planctomycetota bacterium]
PNHLHGGHVGFDKVIWDARLTETEEGESLELAYLSVDGDENYPGNLDVKVTYQLNSENEFWITYSAVTDKPTHVNLTQHSYFNLKGEGRGSVLDHQIKIYADCFTPINETAIPVGEQLSVEGTAFDFREMKRIGQDIHSDDEQLKFGIGYDHNFVIQGPPGAIKKAAEVFEPESGRTLEVFTEEPGVQFYTGNYLDGRLVGKSGLPYLHRGGLCLETQHFPDSPNQPNFPSTLLEPGHEYLTRTKFCFGVMR